MKKTKISIIIPVYNGEKYIENCVKNLQSQILKEEIEIIFVNDGSTDHTKELLDKYATKDDRIVVFHQKNAGVSVARNFGMKKAKGEWIVFVDVDDKMDEGYLEDIAEEIEENSEIPVFIYARHYVEKNKKKIDTTKFTKEKLIRYLLVEEEIEELGDDFLLFAVWSKVYKKSFLEENRIAFIEGLRWSEDIIFMCRVFQCAKNIQFVYRGYYHYIQNEDSTIHKARKDDVETIKKIQIGMREALKSIWEKEGIQEAYYESILNGWFIAISSEIKAWKNEERFWKSYMHLRNICKEEAYKTIVSKIKSEQLGNKIKVKLLLLKYCKIGYLFMIRR